MTTAELIVTKKIGNKNKQDSGLRAIIDLEFYETLKIFTWGYDSDGYPRAWYGGKMVKLHHFIIGKPDPGYVVNHINRNTLDNRRCNLEFATYGQNTRNVSKTRGSSKYMNVFWRKERNSWSALITGANGQSVRKGGFKQETDAAHAADELKRIHLPISLQYSFNFPREGES